MQVLFLLLITVFERVGAKKYRSKMGALGDKMVEAHVGESLLH